VSYLEINTWFITGVLVATALLLLRGVRPRIRAMLGSFLVVGVLTAIFDNAIIGAGLVAYDESTLSGVMVGVAPVEDFAYTLAGAIVIPMMWEALGKWGRSPR
jgi:lycopene cyclase domain-containing protein